MTTTMSAEEAWSYVTRYLRASDGDADQKTLQRCMKQLNDRDVYEFYRDLVRTTFTYKIVPALQQVQIDANTLPGIVANLSDGLTRYEQCLARLGLPAEYSIGKAFRALVGLHLPQDQCRRAIRDYLQSWDDLGRSARHCGLGRLYDREYRRRQAELAVEHDRLESLSSHAEACATRTAKLCIAELFDLVVAFPDSAERLDNLKRCLSPVTRASLVQQFAAQCQRRLLHPGASTSTIIDFYISTIRAMLLLDPHGVLLDRVARPIRKYLRERSDTIRTIMISLLGGTREQQDEEMEDDDDEWTPDPIDAAPDYMKGRASDIVHSLTSIYENKEVFVRELQSLLASRLLATTSYDTSQEAHDLEMLKSRFGDEMAVCDVMLRDIGDSKRIDRSVNIDGVHLHILSRLYWPNLPKRDELVLPQAVADKFAHYSDRFGEIKAERHLKLVPSMGHVRVRLELRDRELDVIVSPAHATVINLFDNRESVALGDAASAIGKTTAETRRLLQFWQRQGVLQEVSNELYSVIEEVATDTLASGDGAASGAQTGNALPIEPDVDPGTGGEEEDEMEVYWQFVVGMLTNVGAMPCERINSMLGMFAPSYGKSVDELRDYLSRKVRAGALDFKAGNYTLP